MAQSDLGRRDFGTGWNQQQQRQIFFLLKRGLKGQQLIKGVTLMRGSNPDDQSVAGDEQQGRSKTSLNKLNPPPPPPVKKREAAAA